MKIIEIPGPTEFVSTFHGNSLGRMFLDSLEFSMTISNLLAVVFKDPFFLFVFATGGSPRIQYLPVIREQKQK